MSGLFLTIFMCLSGVLATKLADGVFNLSNYDPASHGIWRASGFCNFAFPGYEVATNSGYVYTRFGVAVTEYNDYLGGFGVVKQSADNRTLIAAVGHASSNGKLAYQLEFQYKEYIGYVPPLGDCQLFTDLTEAINTFDTTPSLVPALKDELLANVRMEYQYSSSNQFRYRCKFNFTGSKFGEKEAAILMNFTVPITYYQDYTGNVTYYEDPGHTWRIVLYTFAAKDECETFVDVGPLSARDAAITDGTCSLFMGEDSAYEAVLAVQTTTTTATTTSTARQEGTASSPTTLNLVETTTPATIEESSNMSTVLLPLGFQTGMFTEDEAKRDLKIVGTVLWTFVNENLLFCGRQCLTDAECIAVEYIRSGRKCNGFSVINGTGQAQNNSSLYNVD